MNIYQYPKNTILGSTHIVYLRDTKSQKVTKGFWILYIFISQNYNKSRNLRD